MYSNSKKWQKNYIPVLLNYLYISFNNIIYPNKLVEEGAVILTN